MSDKALGVRQLKERVQAVLFQPRQALPVSLADSGAARDVLMPYVLALSAIAPLALFVSDGILGAWHPPTSVFNTRIPGAWVRTPLPALAELGLTWAIAIGSWALLSAALLATAPTFGGIKDRAGANKAAAYTLTPLYVAGALLLFGSVPYLTWLAGVGLVAGAAWSVFVGVVALPLHLGTPESRAPAHGIWSLAITALAAILVYVLGSAAIFALSSAT